MSKLLSLWVKEDRFDGIVFPEKVAKLIKSLNSKGIYDCEIVMLSRTYGQDLSKWKEYLKEMFDRGLFKGLADDKELMDEQTLWELRNTLENEGLIRDYGDSLREIDWFIKNFDTRAVLGHIKADSFLESLLKKSTRHKASPYSLAHALHGHVYTFWDGVAEPLQAAAWTYMEKILSQKQYGEVANDIYGRGEPDQEVLEEAKKQLSEHVNRLMRILLMELLERGPLTWPFGF